MSEEKVQSSFPTCIDIYKKSIQSKIDADPHLNRSDTIEQIYSEILLFEKDLNEFLHKPHCEREKCYKELYQATMLLFNTSTWMRKFKRSLQATRLLGLAISICESVVPLLSGSFINWRLQIYVQLAYCYEDMDALKAASNVIEHALNQVNNLKEIEEQDPPIPDDIQSFINEAYRVLNTMQAKYMMHSGSITADAWRKKIEEEIPEKPLHRTIALLEGLSSTKYSRWMESEPPKWKKAAVKSTYDFMIPYIKTAHQAIMQYFELEEKRKKLKTDLEATAKEEPEKTAEEVINEYVSESANQIRDSDWRQSIEAVPLELHIELIKHVFHIRDWNIFDELTEMCLVRTTHRRYEVPYLSTIDILASYDRQAHLPDGFEAVSEDLNVEHLREQLALLRENATIETSPIKKKGKPTKTEAKKEKKIQKEGKKKEEKKGKEKSVKKFESSKEELIVPQVQASEDELSRIKHPYIKLMIERTSDAKYAIQNLRTIEVQEDSKPQIDENEYAVAIPLTHSTKSNKCVYIVFRRTNTCLKNEEELINVIIDVKCMFTRSQDTLPPIGYNKIPVDLKINKQNQEGAEFIYLIYRTDLAAQLALRDLEMMRGYSSVERSLKEDYENDLDNLLIVNFDKSSAEQMSEIIASVIRGPVGTIYLHSRKDPLTDTIEMLFKKCIYEQTKAIDYAYEMDSKNYFDNDFSNQLRPKLEEFQKFEKKITTNLHSVMNKLPIVDPILYGELSIIAGQMNEYCGDYRTAVQILRSSASKINALREAILSPGNSFDKAANPFKYVTSTNSVIKVHHKNFSIHFEKWKKEMRMLQRQKLRKQKQSKLLDTEESKQEENEIDQLQAKIENIKNRGEEEANNDEEVEEGQKKNLQSKFKPDSTIEHFELDGLIGSLVVDIYSSLFRCEARLECQSDSDRMNTMKTITQQGIEMGHPIKGISNTLKAKMKIDSGVTATKLKKDLYSLETTLQEAGKLPLPQPVLNTQEKMLLKECNKNIYLKALLLLELSAYRNNTQESSALLIEAMKSLKEAEENEELISGQIVKAAPYIVLKYGKQFQELRKDLTDQDLLELIKIESESNTQDIPNPPYIIGRTSTTMTFVLPIFQFKIKSSTNLPFSAIYGKESGVGVSVSLTNTELPGTGKLLNQGSTITISELIPNESYTFAMAVYEDKNNCFKGIGKSSSPYASLNPLPLGQIYCYISEIAYKTGQIQCAEKASLEAIKYITKKTDYRCNYLNSKNTPIFSISLDFNALSSISISEIRHYASAFLIHGSSLFMKIRLSRKKKSDTNLPIDEQKKLLKFSNFIMLALQLGMTCEDWLIVKESFYSAYNITKQLYKLSPLPPIILPLLVTSIKALSSIPQRRIDIQIGSIASCLCYQLTLACLNNNEKSLLQSCINMQISIFKRQSKVNIRKYLEKVEMSEEDKETMEKQKKEIEEGGSIPEDELIKEPEPVEKIEGTLEVIGEEGEALEEFLLWLGDYQNEALTMSEINKYMARLKSNLITDSESKLAEYEEYVDQLVQFWASLKDLGESSLNNIDYENNSRALEFACKGIRRLLESKALNNAKIIEWVEYIPLDKIPNLDSSKLDLTNHLQDFITDSVQRFNKRMEVFMNLIKDKSSNEINLYEMQMKLEQATNEKKELIDDKKQIMLLTWISELFFIKANAQFKDFTENNLACPDDGSYIFHDLSLLDFEQIKKETELIIKSAKELQEKKDLAKIKKDEKDQEKKEGEELEEEKKEEEENKENSEEKEEFEEETTYVPFLESLAKSTEYAVISNSKIHSKNCFFLLWNFLKYSLQSPDSLKKNQGWCLISLICLNLVIALENEHFKRENVNSNDDIFTYGNVLGFIIQCLMRTRKWKWIVELGGRFNIATHSSLAQYILPFIIYSQTKIYEESVGATKNKKDLLHNKTEEFNKWAATKKKKSRMAMLTGEIPPEEQLFLKEKAELEEEIRKLECIESLLNDDKRISESQLNLIKRDLSIPKETLTNCRRLYAKFCSEQKEQLNQKNEIEHIQVSNLRKIFSNNLINNYSKAIELLRRTQERLLLAQALDEMGNILFSNDRFAEAETAWNDSVDTIFQNLNIIINYPKHFEPTRSISSTYGLRECLHSVIILSKLAFVCYSNNLTKKTQCYLLIGRVCEALFKDTLPHPQQVQLLFTYAIEMINKKEEDIIGSLQSTNGSILLNSFMDSCRNLIRLNEFKKAVYACEVAEYISRKICLSKNDVLESRAIKGIGLSSLGFIQEGIALFNTIRSKNDIPELSARENIFTDNQNKRFLQGDKLKEYINSQPFYHDVNKKILEEISSADIEKIHPSYFQLTILKSIIVMKACGNDIVGMSVDKIDDRLKFLKRIEESLRNSLKLLGGMISINEKLYQYEIIKLQDVNSEELNKIENEITNICSNFGIDKPNIIVSQYQFEHSEKIKLSAYIRILLSKLYEYLNQNSSAMSSLLNGFINLKKFTFGNMSSEEGSDFKGISAVPEGIIASGGSGKDKGKPVKQEVKKVPKKQDKEKTEEIKEKSIEEELIEIEKASIESGKTKNDLGVAWEILKFKFEVLRILYKQNRGEECKKVIENLLRDCKALNDTYFLKETLQIKCYISVQMGNPNEAKNHFQEIDELTKNFEMLDISLAQFKANMAELYILHYKDLKIAGNLLKQSRLILWMFAQEIGLDLAPVSANELYIKSGINIIKNHKNKHNEISENKSVAPSKKGEKGEKNKKLAKPNKVEEGINPNIHLEEPKLEILTDDTLETEEPDEKLNCNIQSQNIYLENIELILKVDLRYSLVLLLEDKMDQAEKVLHDIEKLSKYFIFVSPIQLLYLQILKARELRLRLRKEIKLHFDKFTTDPKYEYIVKMIPSYGFPSGNIMRELPMYSIKYISEFNPIINQIQEHLKKALEISITSAPLGTFEIFYPISEIFYEASKLSFIKFEFRPEPTPKYVDIQNYLKSVFPNDEAKLNENIEIIKEEWKKSKLISEEEFKYNIECRNRMVDLEKNISIKYENLISTSLIDPSRCPREVITDIYESDYIARQKYSSPPSSEVNMKTSLSSQDVLCYLLSLTKSLKTLTFGKEPYEKLISILHLYLKTNLAGYKQICESFDELYQSSENPELMKENRILLIWHEILINDKSEMLYFLGNSSQGNDAGCGELLISVNDLGNFVKKLQIFGDKFSQKSKLSEEIFKRESIDLKNEYNNLLIEMGKLWAPLVEKELISKALSDSGIGLTEEVIFHTIDLVNGLKADLEDAGLWKYLRELHKLRNLPIKKL